MAQLIKVRKGLDASLPGSANLGEPLYTTDTKKMFIGNGDGNPLTEVLTYSSGGVCKVIKVPVLTTTVSSTYSVPIGAIIREVKLKIKTAYSAGTTIAVTVDGTTPLSIMAAGDNDPETTGIYYVNGLDEVESSNAGSIKVTITGSPSAGEAILLVDTVDQFLS